MTNAEIFIDKYKQLEEVVRSAYNLKNSESISYCLNEQAKFQKFRDDIKYCQEVRNLLSHKKKVSNSFAVEPSQQMITFIEGLIQKIQKRPRCSDIQVKIGQVYWQTVGGNVKETIKAMREHLYTHTPILENGTVIGVFDENSIFCYLADEEIVEISSELTFNDIKRYISLNGREMEDFLFFKPTQYVEELENKFEEYYKKGKRVGIAFLTQNGTATEKLQGIVTPWDIISAAE